MLDLNKEHWTRNSFESDRSNGRSGAANYTVSMNIDNKNKPQFIVKQYSCKPQKLLHSSEACAGHYNNTMNGT